MSAPRLVLGRYGAKAIEERLSASGVHAALAARGFADPEVVVEDEGALPRVRLFGCKQGERYSLVEASIGETTIPVEFFRARGHAMDRAVELVLVWWLREEDPTRPFTSERPALPLQHHPGLGVLRRAFRAIVGLAQEIGSDGVASVPKFFHDAVIFVRSRLFLFLDPEEQGRFEAMVRDLSTVPLGDASLALLDRGVVDGDGRLCEWCPSYLVFPLSERLTGYLNSAVYEEGVARALATARYRCVAGSVEAARSV